MLTQETVIPYLVQSGRLTVKDLVREAVSVRDASRRNGNFHVERRTEDGFLVKQAREPGATKTIAWEAHMYRAFQVLPASHPLRRHTVPFIDYDAENGVLVLERIPRARSLAARHREGRFPIGAARQVGRALAALHSLDPDSVPWHDVSRVAPRRIPHALLLHRPDDTFYCDASQANLEAVRLIQSFPSFCTLIDHLRAEWQANSLVHFDLKADNILYRGDPDSRSVWLIDWELAAVGDAAWDVGSMFADYLGIWLPSIPMAGEGSPADYLSLARFPLTKLQPVIRAFWESYRVARGLNGGAATAFLMSAVRYSAVRLIQSVHEQTLAAVDLAADTICQLQLSWNILKAPAPACAQLLGLNLVAPEVH